MRPETPGLLWDARRATGLIAQFVADRTWQDYESDPMLRSAVERQFQIIGEALNKLSRLDPSTAAQIPDLSRIVAFRNVLPGRRERLCTHHRGSEPKGVRPRRPPA